MQAISAYEAAFKTFVSFSRFITGAADNDNSHTVVARLMISSLFIGTAPPLRTATAATAKEALTVLNECLVGASVWVSEGPLSIRAVITARLAVIRFVHSDDKGVFICLSDPITDAAVLRRKLYLWRGDGDWEATIMAFDGEDPFICTSNEDCTPVLLFWSLANKITQKRIGVLNGPTGEGLKVGDLLHFAPKQAPQQQQQPQPDEEPQEPPRKLSKYSQDAWLNMWQRGLCSSSS